MSLTVCQFEESIVKVDESYPSGWDYVDPEVLTDFDREILGQALGWVGY